MSHYAGNMRDTCKVKFGKRGSHVSYSISDQRLLNVAGGTAGLFKMQMKG